MAVSLRRFFESVAKIFPEVKKPKRKVSLTEKLVWTAVALIAFVFMSETALYGLPKQEGEGTSPLILSIVFAQNFGTLMTLGIGPIVTAGLILQLLVGAEIIKLDLTKPDDRALFTSVSKLFTIVVTAFEAGGYVLGGQFGPLSTTAQTAIFAQLIFATIVVMLLDELVQKGWGLGSGVSLFIAVGVALTIIWSLFSPVAVFDQIPRFQGLVLAFLEVLGAGAPLDTLLFRTNNMPDLIGLTSTAALLTIIVYLEAVKVEIPISYAKFSGYRAKYPVKLLYVSNVPVIFASVVFQSVYNISSLIWSQYNRANDNLLLNILGRFEVSQGRPIPTGGLAYYMTSPGAIFGNVDMFKALIFMGFMLTFSVLFAIFWVQIGGLSPNKVAQQLIKAGMQVPGFRRSPGIIANIIEKYIRVVTILGAIIVGLIASVGDFFSVYGSGTGILLMSGILYQYYELLLRERLTEMYPMLSGVMGE